MRDDRVFEKSLTDLVSYYGEIIEDPKLSFQEEFIFKIFKKTVSLANEEEILFGLCREMSNFLFKVKLKFSYHQGEQWYTRKRTFRR